MLIMQLGIILLILSSAIVFKKLNTITLKSKKKAINHHLKDFSNSNIFFLLIFGVILFITIFRGTDIGVDYPTYLEISNRLAETKFEEIWTLSGISMEPLLILTLKLCSTIHLGLVPFITITTVIVLFIYYKEFKINSDIPWLSMIIMLILGSYFTIFNTTAQFVTCALMFGAASYLYKGNFLKYALFISIIALFHKTALFMIPVYFILRYKMSTYSHRKVATIFIIFIAISILLIYFESIISYATPIFFPEYNNRSISSFNPANTFSLVRPLIITLFLLINVKYINFNDIKERVWFNASSLCLIITVISLQFGPIQRFSYFLLPYITLIIPRIISKIDNKILRIKYISIIIFILIIYVVIVYSFEDLGYRFLWQ